MNFLDVIRDTSRIVVARFRNLAISHWICLEALIDLVDTGFADRATQHIDARYDWGHWVSQFVGRHRNKRVSGGHCLSEARYFIA